MAIGIRVYGKVQGVFFRATTKTTAEDLKLTGWVRNEPDGSVRIHAEGEENLISRLYEWCKEGPQFAKVANIERWKSLMRDLKLLRSGARPT